MKISEGAVRSTNQYKDGTMIIKTGENKRQNYIEKSKVF